MGRGILGLVTAAGASLLLAGCSDVIYDRKLSGSYRLLAIDTRNGMTVCRRLPNVFCVGDQLPGPIVFAAGANERYIVIARHPEGEHFGPDRSVSHYHYVVRGPGDEPLQVVGPLTPTQYQAEKRRLGLPEFTHRFPDLE